MIYYLEEPPDNESGEVDFSLPNPSDEVTIAFLWNSVHTFSLEAPHTSKLLWGKNGLNRPWGFKPFNVLGLKCNWVAQNCSSIHAGKWVLKLELGWPRKLQQKMDFDKNTCFEFDPGVALLDSWWSSWVLCCQGEGDTGGSAAHTRCFFNWYPPKNSKYKKVNLG